MRQALLFCLDHKVLLLIAVLGYSLWPLRRRMRERWLDLGTVVRFVRTVAVALPLELVAWIRRRGSRHALPPARSAAGLQSASPAQPVPAPLRRAGWRYATALLGRAPR
jgi:hypothetical protein